MQTHTLLRLTFAACIASLHTQAFAQSPGFTSPSGNVVCVYSKPELRCDVLTRTNPSPRKPKDCPVDYGGAFALRKSGSGELLCHGDTLAGHPDAGKALAYGATWKLGGIRCDSASTGVTCTNESGKGFELSRTAQRLF